MSEKQDTVFQIYYHGKFVTEENGDVSYTGGEMHLLQTQAEFLFRGLLQESPISLYGQRIWYKLPYEKMKDLKILGNGGETLRLMCEAARWTHFVEIYMEHENVEDEVMNEEVEEQGQNIGETAEENQSIGKTQEVNQGGHGNREAEFEEDIRIEAAVGEISDGEENENYRDTPPCSDDEGEQNRNPYERWKRGSGELHDDSSAN